MKSLVVYYSYSGNSAKIAAAKAAELDAPLLEIKDIRRPSTLGAYTRGCVRALRQKPAPIAPPALPLDEYQRFIICCPIWAGFPAPPFNALLPLLPAGAELELIMVSGSGEHNGRPRVIEQIDKLGLRLLSYIDVKA